MVLLLEWGADPCVRAGYDDCPFTVALKGNGSSIELLQFLDCRGGINQEEVKILLTEESREQKDQHGNTALQVAIKHSRNIPFLNWLGKTGANVYTTENPWDTILHRLITAEVNTEHWTILSNSARSCLMEKSAATRSRHLCWL
jgi:ankyrin repeat protein